MRRWHAVPVAVLTALTVGMALFTNAAPVRAGNPTPPPTPSFTLSVDCNSTGTGDTSIQSSCSLLSGTTSVTVGIVLTNVTGPHDPLLLLPVDVTPNAFGFTLTAGEGLTSTALPAENTAVLGSGNFDCTLGGPPTQDPESLGCFLGIGKTGTTVADGASIVLSRITYNIPGDVGPTFTLTNGELADTATGILITGCLDGINNANACFDATLSVGGAGVPTSTPTSPAAPTDTPTPTNTPTATRTPACNANGTATPQGSTLPPCPTNTPQNFVTVTPTPGGETATVPAGTGETPAPPPPGGGGQPSGNTGGAGGRPITLPDTGSGGGNSIDWSTASLLALIALAAGGVAGGAYVMAARRSSRDGR
jgi:hypothetical protein